MAALVFVGICLVLLYWSSVDLRARALRVEAPTALRRTASAGSTPPEQPTPVLLEDRWTALDDQQLARLLDGPPQR